MNDLHDVYVAATARTELLPVLAANGSRSERVEGVRVVDWAGY